MPEVDLLELNNQLVIAPAGCGKTYQIADALRRYEGRLPILVLTHTNAGVASLRQKLTSMRVPNSRYRLSTIDGWALRLVASFPERSGYPYGLTPNKVDYVRVRKACWFLLREKHISDIMKANYSRIIIDEYQDSSFHQHGIFYWASKLIPVCVLGDPMQAIFGFGDDLLAKWDEHVCVHFPQGAELSIPWRWRNADNEVLGNWLLEARAKLIASEAIDLASGPASIRVVELHGDRGDYGRLVEASKCEHRAGDEKTLVIGDSRSADSRYKIAKCINGMITVEPVEMKDVIKLSNILDISSKTCVGAVLRFAECVITNVGAEHTIKRLETIAAGRERTPATDIERLALAVQTNPSFQGILNVLIECSKQPGCRTYRPLVFRTCLRAIRLCISTPGLSFQDAAIRIREEYRVVGRQIPRHAIGSTLLLKGLEADHVVILNADDLDTNNLYVAMTRGAKTVTICTHTRILHPGMH